MMAMLVMCKRNHCKSYRRVFHIQTHQTSDIVSNALESLPLRNIKVQHSFNVNNIVYLK